MPSELDAVSFLDIMRAENMTEFVVLLPADTILSGFCFLVVPTPLSVQMFCRYYSAMRQLARGSVAPFNEAGVAGVIVAEEPVVLQFLDSIFPVRPWSVLESFDFRGDHLESVVREFMLRSVPFPYDVRGSWEVL